MSIIFNEMKYKRPFFREKKIKKWKFQISEFKFQTNITWRDTTSFKTLANYNKLSNQITFIKKHDQDTWTTS